MIDKNQICEPFLSNGVYDRNSWHQSKYASLFETKDGATKFVSSQFSKLGCRTYLQPEEKKQQKIPFYKTQSSEPRFIKWAKLTICIADMNNRLLYDGTNIQKLLLL